MRSIQQMYDSVRACGDDSKALFALMREIATEASSQRDEAVAEVIANPPDELVKAVRKAPQKPLTELERANAIIALIDARLLDQTITAAEIAQLKDIVQIKPRERDIVIERVDFSDAMPEQAGLLEVANRVLVAQANGQRVEIDGVELALPEFKAPKYGPKEVR